MKIIIAGLVVLSTSLFAQQKPVVSVLELEQNVKNSSVQNISFGNPLLNANPSKKSTGLAIIYSLLLPGMGELYANNYSSGIYFTIAEGALWATYIGMNVYAGDKKDNYKAYATANASVNTEGKDDAFFATISEFNSLESFNDQKALERNFSEMYNSDSYYWKWNSNEERHNYREMWISSEQTFNDLRFVVGAMLINRIVSAINAVRLVSAYNKSLESEVGWNVSVGVENKVNLPASLNVYFHTSF